MEEEKAAQQETTRANPGSKQPIKEPVKGFDGAGSLTSSPETGCQACIKLGESMSAQRRHHRRAVQRFRVPHRVSTPFFLLPRQKSNQRSTCPKIRLCGCQLFLLPSAREALVSSNYECLGAQSYSIHSEAPLSSGLCVGANKSRRRSRLRGGRWAGEPGLPGLCIYVTSG